MNLFIQHSYSKTQIIQVLTPYKNNPIRNNYPINELKKKKNFKGIQSALYNNSNKDILRVDNTLY